MTKVELDLFTKESHHSMIKSAIHGGVSIISKRFAKANNQFFPDYDRRRDHSYLVFLDQNNLYGWAMSQFLPVGKFRWLSREEIEKIDIFSLRSDDPIGTVFEVDLKCPKELHNEHNDYPVAAENLTISKEMMSGFQKDLYPKEYLDTSIKLMPNLYDKKNCVVDYRNLQFYLKQGLKLEKIQRVLSFSQSNWLSVYIDYNTLKRRESICKFAKDFLSL